MAEGINLSERHRLASLRTSSGLVGVVATGTLFLSTERKEAIRSTNTLPKLRGLIVRLELRLSSPKETAMITYRMDDNGKAIRLMDLIVVGSCY